MKARLKADYIYPVIRACGGAEFVKTEWRSVPAEHEKAALVHGDLEIMDETAPTAKVYLDALDPQPKAKEIIKKGRK